MLIENKRKIIKIGNRDKILKIYFFEDFPIF